MNKKRKILTLAALIVFSAIILFHYTDWKVINYQSPWVSEREAGDYEISAERGQGNVVTILSGPWTIHNPGGADHNWYKIKIEGRGGFYVGSPPINDIRMPLFVLAVFYTGFFYILGPSPRR